MKTAPRLWAIFLVFSLALPQSVFALRSENTREIAAQLAGLEEKLRFNLKPSASVFASPYSAGMEEVETAWRQYDSAFHRLLNLDLSGQDYLDESAARKAAKVLLRQLVPATPERWAVFDAAEETLYAAHSSPGFLDFKVVQKRYQEAREALGSPIGAAAETDRFLKPEDIRILVVINDPTARENGLNRIKRALDEHSRDKPLVRRIDFDKQIAGVPNLAFARFSFEGHPLPTVIFVGADSSSRGLLERIQPHVPTIPLVQLSVFDPFVLAQVEKYVVDRLPTAAGMEESVTDKVRAVMGRVLGSPDQVLGLKRLLREEADVEQQPVAILFPLETVEGDNALAKSIHLTEIQGTVEGSLGWRKDLPMRLELSIPGRANQFRGDGYRVIQVVSEEGKSGILSDGGILLAAGLALKAVVENGGGVKEPFLFSIDVPALNQEAGAIRFPDLAVGLGELLGSA